MSMKPAGKLHDLFSMPSPSQTDNSRQDEKNCSTPVKRSSLQHRPPRSSKEKEPNSCGRKPLKPAKTGEQTGPYEHDAVAEKFSLKNCDRPCLSKNATGLDEVVKYMSSVPSYLQHLDKANDNFQVKAFNFGVLEWDRLEKWTYLQKQGSNRRNSDSPSSSNSSPSSTFSTFASTSHSTRSTASPVPQRKQDVHQSTIVEGHQSKLMDGKNSAQVMMNPDSKTSRGRPSIKYSPEKGSSIDKPESLDIGSPSCTSNINDSSAFPRNKFKSQTGKSRGTEKLKNYEDQSSPQNLDLSENWLQEECLVVEGMMDHLQESAHARRNSCDSAAVNYGRAVEVSRNSFSGNLFPIDVQFTSRPSDISYSCPLRSASQGDEPSVSRTSNELLPPSAKSKHMKVGLSSDLSAEKSAPILADNSVQGEGNLGAAPPHRFSSAGLTRIKCSSLSDGSLGHPLKQMTNKYHEDTPTTRISVKRSISPHRMLTGSLNRIRNSYRGEGSSGQEMKQTIFSEKSNEELAASASNKSRRSPLRRIIDPLMKLKNPLPQTHDASNGQISSGNEPCKSSDSETSTSVQAESHGNSTQQALLKLAWKNELPVFVFSSSQSTVLAATMGKRNVDPKDGFECMYTIFTAEELKKKGRIWGNQGNKNKKHDLAYNIVCQMRVSSMKSAAFDSRNYCVTREFVLVGAQLSPTSHTCVSPLSKSELAAIVTEIQNERPKNPDLQSLFSRGQSQTNSGENRCFTESLQDELKHDSSSTASVVAILPSGVHGTSSTGQPSSLIDRWRSGGACDCGGWDEGCMLTILTNKIPESRRSNSSESFTADGSHIVELFNQGETGENKHAFKMTAFREGVYAVDFGASISLLQAFAMCIAVLHARKPTTLSGLLSSRQTKSFREQTIDSSITSQKDPDGARASYVPHHPPLSPVRRS